MQRRLPRAALAALLMMSTTLGGSQAYAHDAPGSTDYEVPVPDYTFSGEAYVNFSIFGPPAAKEILHATLDLTFVAPAGQMLASDVVIEIDFPLTSGTFTWVLHGDELGWPAASGTFEASLDTDAFNGVLAGPAGGITIINQAIGSATGSTWGHFMNSTLTLELAADTCQKDLGFAGPGTMQLQVCGEALGSGQSADLVLTQAPPSSPVFFALGTSANPTPFYGGQLVPLPLVAVQVAPSDASGTVAVMVPGGGGPLTFYVQAVAQSAASPFGYLLSNALEIELLP